MLFSGVTSNQHQGSQHLVHVITFSAHIACMMNAPLDYTDASGEAMGAVLVQGEERVVENASKQFNPAQKNYSVIEREALAVIWAITKFRPYIDGLHFVVHSDHDI